MSARKPTALERFRGSVAIAMVLPSPARLLRDVLASNAPHDGMRAATYEARVRGTGIDSEESVRLTQPEREAERRAFGAPVPDHIRSKLAEAQRDDILAIAISGEAWMIAVASLLAEVLETGCPDMDDYAWGDAVKDAHLMLELDGGGRMRAAIDVGRNVGPHLHDAIAAIRVLQRLHHRYNPHAADPWTRYRQAGGRIDEICEIHATLDPPIFKPKHGADQLCKTCADLRRTGGERPPVALVELLERGGQVEYRKARARWLESLDVQAAS